MALAMAGFTLSIRPVSSLLPHEQTIPLRVKQLVEEIRKDEIQRDPMIVDRESATILDGMHRLSAFEVLQLENAVCCLVDYNSPAVTLERWARVYTIGEGENLRESLASFPNVKRTTLAEAFAALQRRDVGVAVLTTDAAYVLGDKGSQEEVGVMMSSFDRLSEERGWERRFVAGDDIDVPLQEKRNFGVLPRRLTKEDVITAARLKRLFPCKTSMHVIDPRPVAVNFPISELNTATSATLGRRLRGRVGRVAPSGSIYEGRRYKERLLFLDQT